MPAPKFAHVVYQTSHPEAMKNYYRDLLEAEVVFEGGGLTFLTFDEEHHRIALAHIPDLVEQQRNQAMVNHVAYTFDSLAELLDRYEELSAKGIEPWNPVQHGVTTSLYYADPDGNHIEMQVDNFATPEEANTYMEGPEFDANPIGVGFRPELMLEALRAGTPVDELQTRAWALATSPELPHPMER